MWLIGVPLLTYLLGLRGLGFRVFLPEALNPKALEGSLRYMKSPGTAGRNGFATWVAGSWVRPHAEFWGGVSCNPDPQKDLTIRSPRTIGENL